MSFFISSSLSQTIISPHKNLSIQCSNCHLTDSWSQLKDKLEFDHNIETNFPLIGQHKIVECKSCHNDLSFVTEKISAKGQVCVNCHNDQHNRELGNDCEKCHTTKNWMVENINEIHNDSRFPLLGAHKNVNCKSCHINTQKNV